MVTVAQEQLLAAQKEIQEKMANLRTELRETGERLFKEGSQDLFDAFPKLQAFSWHQYTPYFNDGEECVFGANTDGVYIELEGVESDEDDKYDGSLPWELRAKPESSYFREPADDNEVAMLAVYSLVNSVDEATLRDLFDDHVEVRVTRDGIDVTEYEHE